MKYEPRTYQNLIVDHIFKHERCAIWASMGLGKTVAVLTALDGLDMMGKINGSILVLAPLRVAKSTWPKELAKWDHLKYFTMSVIAGSSEGQRRKALHTKADIYTINYENTVWLINYCRDILGYWPFETIIADESTKLKGFRTKQGAKRAKALAQKAHDPTKRFIELTGTPAPNGLKDLWGQLWFIDAGRRLGRSYSAFCQRWFCKTFDGYGLEPLKFTQEEIQTQVKDVCLSLDAADYFDLEEPIHNTIYVDLPPRARTKYDEMEKEMFTELEDEYRTKHTIEAFNAAARTMKCSQIASGAAYTNYVENANGVKKPTGWTFVHDEKIEALKDIIEEAAGAPVMVAYHFRSDLARILKAFPTARVLDSKPETEDDWNEGKIPILVAHPESASHGLNLQHGGNILAFFSHTWNLEHFMQMIERIGPVRQMQSGYNRPVFLHYIVARDTVDEMVMLRRETKREVQDILLEAVKRRTKSEMELI